MTIRGVVLLQGVLLSHRSVVHMLLGRVFLFLVSKEASFLLLLFGVLLYSRVLLVVFLLSRVVVQIVLLSIVFVVLLTFFLVLVMVQFSCFNPPKIVCYY